MSKITMIEVRVSSPTAATVGALIGAFTDCMPSLRAIQGWLAGQLVLEALGLSLGELSCPYSQAIARALSLCERAHLYPGRAYLQRNRIGADPAGIFLGTNEEHACQWDTAPSDIVVLHPNTSPRNVSAWRSANGREVVIHYDFTKRPSDNIAGAVLEEFRRLIASELPDPIRLAEGHVFQPSISVEVTREPAAFLAPLPARPAGRAKFRADEGTETATGQ